MAKRLYNYSKNSKFDALIFTKELLQDSNEIQKKPPFEPPVPKNGVHFKESVALSAILDYLLLEMALGKLFVQRINNAPIYDSVSRSYRSMPKGAHDGFPDIYVLKGSRTIFFEVKSSTGSQRPEQVKMQFELEKQGAEYYVVRSVDYVMKALISIEI